MLDCPGEEGGDVSRVSMTCLARHVGRMSMHAVFTRIDSPQITSGYDTSDLPPVSKTDGGVEKDRPTRDSSNVHTRIAHTLILIISSVVLDTGTSTSRPSHQHLRYSQPPHQHPSIA